MHRFGIALSRMSPVGFGRAACPPRSAGLACSLPPARSLSPACPLLLACLLPMLGLPVSAAAQNSERPVDRVLAVVGDSVVLMSEVLNREEQMRLAGLPVPQPGSPEMAAFRRQVLNDLVDNQLILQAAAQDTLLSVDEELVDDSVQSRFTQVEGNYATRAEMDADLQRDGLTVQAYREMLREQIRQSMLVGLYVQRYGGDGAAEVTEEEARERFEAGRDDLQQRPATVTFKQLVLTVSPSDSSLAEARGRIEALLTRARTGEDFAQLAMDHSEDPGSAPAGGDLGWFRRGAFVDEFEDAAFELLEGNVSDVVETPFGFHIIKVDRVRFAERQGKHILIRPRTGPADLTRARALAEDVAARADTEEFQALIDQYHTAALLPDSATIPRNQIAQVLPPAYLSALSGRAPGEVVGPIQFTFRDEEYFAVVKILETREAGTYVFEDLAPQIRSTLLRQKRMEALVDGLRAKAHIEIK